MWTSKDGLHFEHHSVSVEAKKIGTKNATYTRFHEYPLRKYGSKYIMLYVGFDQTAGIRHLWLAHSKDAENWTQVKTPFVSPGKGETSALYDPELFQWKGKNYIVYADNNVWRGGTLKYVEVDRDLTPVGAGGKRYTLMKGPEIIQGRLRSPQFIVAGGKIHMISGAGKNPRVCAYSTADVDGPGSTKQAADEPAPAQEQKKSGKSKSGNRKKKSKQNSS